MENSVLIDILKKNQSSFYPVVPFYPGKNKIIPLTLGEDNKEINEKIFSDTHLFTVYINNILAENHAQYAIGGYGEVRTVYSSSRIFDGTKEKEEPRRFHIGMDIWGRPYTPVSAPLEGIVHSFGVNEGFGNYGTTIVLTHKLDGFSFHTLYGHLSRSSIGNLHEGLRIMKGDIFSEFGIPAENGQWPPHLHMQIIIDMGNWKGDYPGVCRFSEKDQWIANCPDPDLIVQLKKYVTNI